MTDNSPQTTLDAQGGVTVRGFLLGCLGALAVATLSPYCNMMVCPVGMSADFLTAGALFLFFVIVGILNPILRLLSRPLSLSPQDLLLVYIMMVIASAIPSWGLIQAFIAIVVGLSYYATPENRWADLIHPHVRSWLIPTDPNAVRYYHEGGPEASVPWSAWAVPIACWCAFFVILYFTTICLVILLRRQWVERERLVFPMTQLPLEMVQEDGHRLLNPFFRSRLMWIGFAIPFVIGSWNAMGVFVPLFPQIRLYWWIPILQRSTWVRILLNFPAIGLAYLVSLEVSGSIWFFHLAFRLQSGIGNVLGFTTGERREVYTGYSPMTSHEAMGAMILLCLIVFWNARFELWRVVQSVIRGEDDRQEPLSPRAAFLGFLAGLLGLAVWLKMSGMSLLLVAIVLFASMVIFLALTRIMAEGGVGFGRAQYIPQPFAVWGFGTRIFSADSLTALGFTYVWVSDIRTLVMASAANSLKIGSERRMLGRPLFWAIMAAIGLALAGSIWITLTLCYKNGALNMTRVWFLTGCGRVPWGFVAAKIQRTIEPNWWGWFFTGVGGAVMLILVFLRHHFIWWPIHYIGFPIADSLPVMFVWFDVFLAWLIKLLILKYGGVPLYRKSRPFFLGIIFGAIVCAGVWMIIGAILGRGVAISGALLG